MANSAEKLGVSQDRYDEIKLEVVKSFIQLLQRDLVDPYYDVEQKESLTVAKQCLEAAFDLDAEKIENATDLVNLFHSQNIPSPAQNSDEINAEAEQYKVLGNESMKVSKYDEALQFYTKACRMNPRKAIYFCNRAAAYSRLEKHQNAIQDCKEAIKLDPTYGKAYGRLGIAYSNLQMFREASDAYKKALQLDPTNVTYEANLKLAEDKISPNNVSNNPAAGGFELGALMNNPALLSMATQMLNDPSFRTMVNGLMTYPAGSGDPNLDTFVQVGQQLADHMQANNPSAMENLRQTFVQNSSGGSRAGAGAAELTVPPTSSTIEDEDDEDDDDEDDELAIGKHKGGE